MGKINQKLNSIIDSKADIKSAITEKGVSGVTDVLSTYAEAIQQINTTPPLEEITVTENGEYTPSQGKYGISKVNVNVPSSGGEPVTGFTGIKVFSTLQDAEELNNYATIGALISYKQGVGFTVWNGDPDNLIFDWKAVAKGNPETGKQKSSGSISYWGWNEFSLENNYGKAIAICCGRGLWVSTGWNGSRGEYVKKWATEGTDLYNNTCSFAVHNNGREIARHMYSNTQHLADSPLFTDVKAFDCGVAETASHWFVPSKIELLEIQNNACTGHKQQESGGTVTCEYANYLCYAADINTADYWSASQDGNYADSAVGVYYYDGNVSNNTKSNSYMSFVALHLGNALA